MSFFFLEWMFYGARAKWRGESVSPDLRFGATPPDFHRCSRVAWSALAEGRLAAPEGGWRRRRNNRLLPRSASRTEGILRPPPSASGSLRSTATSALGRQSLQHSTGSLFPRINGDLRCADGAQGTGEVHLPP